MKIELGRRPDTSEVIILLTAENQEDIKCCNALLSKDVDIAVVANTKNKVYAVERVYEEGKRKWALTARHADWEL